MLSLKRLTRSEAVLCRRAFHPKLSAPDVAAHGRRAPVPCMRHDVFVGHAVPTGCGDNTPCMPYGVIGPGRVPPNQPVFLRLVAPRGWLAVALPQPWTTRRFWARRIAETFMLTRVFRCPGLSHLTLGHCRSRLLGTPRLLFGQSPSRLRHLKTVDKVIGHPSRCK
jgi:hypothetical protein